MNIEKRKSFFSVLYVGAIDTFGFALVFVMFAPLLLSPDYHFLPPETSIAMRNFYLGILFLAFPITQFLGAPILGDFADRAGRKKTFAITITGIVIGFLLSGLATAISSLSLLIFSRFFTGFFAGNYSICLSAIADMSHTEKVRSRNFSILIVLSGLSWIFAMLIGGFLSNPEKSKFFSPALPFVISALLTTLSLVAIQKFFKETHEGSPRAKFNLMKGFHNIFFSLKIKQIRPYFFVILLWTTGWGLGLQWFSTYSLAVHNATQAQITWGLLSLGFFWMMGGAVVNPLLLKKFKSLPIALIGFSIGILFFLGMILSKSYFLFCTLYSFSAIFINFAFSNTVTLTSINAPEEVQGKVLGIAQSMMSLGWIIVPIIGANIGAKDANLFYPTAGFSILLATLILAWELRKSVEKKA